MAADPVDDRAGDEVAADDAGPDAGDGDRWPDRSLLSRSALTNALVGWVRFTGPGRLLATLGTVLLAAGIGWWLLRAPATPTEARLPYAGRATSTSAATAGVTSPAPLGGSSSAPLHASTSAPSVMVHVAGAVAQAGVYELPAGARVADAIEAAGGAGPDADPDALNLAAPVVDGDRIAVPTQGGPDAALADGHSHAADPATEGAGVAPVDLNSAGVVELDVLPGIGPATAAAIVEHRDTNGPFAAVDDLEAVPGIGPAKVAALRDLVTV